MQFTGKHLIGKWKIKASQAYYHKTGKFYMPLKRFPGALCDRHGYVLFKTEEEHMRCPQLRHGNPQAKNYRLNVRKPGISEICGYVSME